MTTKTIEESGGGADKQALMQEAIRIKLAAEARKLDADAERARAEARVAEVRTETDRAEAEFYRQQADFYASQTAGQEVLTASNRLGLDHQRRVVEEELASNKYHCIYHFTDVVGPGTVKACMDRLNYWHRLTPDCAMEIIFTSPGGSVIDGLALFDYIQDLRGQGHFVTTRALGMAASMAGILLQAGDKRVIGKEAYVLIHEISTGAIGKIGEIEDEVKFVKKVQGRILDIFAARAKVARSYFQQHWSRKDWWLSSEECLRIGFVDEVSSDPGFGTPPEKPHRRSRKAKKETAED